MSGLAAWKSCICCICSIVIPFSVHFWRLTTILYLSLTQFGHYLPHWNLPYIRCRLNWLDREVDVKILRFSCCSNCNTSFCKAPPPGTRHKITTFSLSMKFLSFGPSCLVAVWQNRYLCWVIINWVRICGVACTLSALVTMCTLVLMCASITKMVVVVVLFTLS